MSVRMILTSEGDSAKFSDRVVEMEDDRVVEKEERVRVTRATREEEPATNNAVFQCKVLSKNHAVFSFRDGEFFLKDNGSSNGSFINNFRLCKPGQASDDQRLFTGDIIRFGSQVHDKQKMVKERCIIAKICLFLPDGSEHCERPSSDRLFRPLSDLKQPQRKSVSFAHQKDLDREHEDHHEKALSEIEKHILERAMKEHLEQEQAQEKMKNKVDNLEKKLKRKQNEANNLVDLINTVKENEDKMILEICDLKEKVKERDKEKDNAEIMKLEIQELKQQLQERDSEKENEMVLKLEIEELKRRLKECEKVTMNEKQMKLEIQDLERKFYEKDTEYTTLEFLMTEESETVHKIEIEMQRLLYIISEYQEALTNKDELIIKLQDTVEETDSEILKIKKELQTVIEDSESTMFSLRVQIEEQNNLLNKQLQIEELQDKLDSQEQLEYENETLKSKMEDLINTINQKNIEIENIQSTLMTQEAIADLEDLQKEVLSLKTSINERDFKLNCLQDTADRQAEIISKNDSLIVNYMSEIRSMRSQLQAKQEQPQLNTAMLEENDALLASMEEKLIKEQEKSKNIEDELEEKNTLLTSLKDKVIKEQEINKEVEDELIKLKIEFDNFKVEKEQVHEENSVKNLSISDHIQLLNLKDEEIKELKMELIREQQIVAHVQMVQEGEIVEKERELLALRDILDQERKILLEKEEEILKLKRSHLQVNGLSEEVPVRPERIRSVLVPSMEVTEESDDDTEAATFHDALSEDEDVLIEDLELDEDWVDVQHGRTDVQISLGDLSLG